jgi:hypothetical protein
MRKTYFTVDGELPANKFLEMHAKQIMELTSLSACHLVKRVYLAFNLRVQKNCMLRAKYICSLAADKFLHAACCKTFTASLF